jgi:hypothetical protein
VAVHGKLTQLVFTKCSLALAFVIDKQGQIEVAIIYVLARPNLQGFACRLTSRIRPAPFPPPTKGEGKEGSPREG